MQSSEQHYDVIIVGAGFGGLYAVHRFHNVDGLKVLGIEGADGVGGVWYHNAYPGSRVDVESIDYCFYFSPELYREWRWTERYATQPELSKYLNHVADRFDLRRHFKFGEWVTKAQWEPENARYRITTSGGLNVTCQYLIMAVGQLSARKKVSFPGLENFKGDWVQSSAWPNRDVRYKGKRVGVVGTGSSGVQSIPEFAKEAKHVYVFQRTPNYNVPAHNGPMNEARWKAIADNVETERKHFFAGSGSGHRRNGTLPTTAYTPEEQLAELEKAWAYGGHGMSYIFTDQGVKKEANDVVANFVRAKIRETVKDPVLAEKLCPYDHPLGTRRLCVVDDYYESFNRDNVTLVDIREHPIERITETGIQTTNAHYEVDLIVFALGFHAFTGSLDSANIRNEHGQQPSDLWKRGPRTLLGLMTVGFPNLFTPTGPGSPSVLANLAQQNEYHLDWISECFKFMKKHGYKTVEPTVEAQDKWTAHVAEVSEHILRRQVKNYMVHVNGDGTRVFIPYVAGMERYSKQADAIAANNYEGFRFASVGAKAVAV